MGLKNWEEFKDAFLTKKKKNDCSKRSKLRMPGKPVGVVLVKKGREIKPKQKARARLGRW